MRLLIISAMADVELNYLIEILEYNAAGEILSLGKRLHIYDNNGYETAYIKEHVLSFLRKYDLYKNGSIFAEITKRFTFIKSSYFLDGLDWEVNGDFMSHDYVISSNGTPIAYIRKAWLTWGDFYEIEILDERNEIEVLAVVLAVDAADHDGNN